VVRRGRSTPRSLDRGAASARWFRSTWLAWQRVLAELCSRGRAGRHRGFFGRAHERCATWASVSVGAAGSLADSRASTGSTVLPAPSSGDAVGADLVAAFVRWGQRSARRSSVPGLLVSWRSDYPSPRLHDALVANTIVRRTRGRRMTGCADRVAEVAALAGH
jgi:hypothetical protein